MFDLIIIGMGPAGIAASIYAKRSNLKVLCLEKGMIGGELNYIDKIDNYPGLNDISGSALAYKLLEHIDEMKIDYRFETVKDILKKDNYYEIETNKEKYTTKYIILATGRKARKLGLENEDTFLGRGISYCAICDGAFFKNKVVEHQDNKKVEQFFEIQDSKEETIISNKEEIVTKKEISYIGILEIPSIIL